ncbi:MAG: putative O-methyltransferase YrrM [Saprospiraceae bacterium]|jgi:predicted O-methyltransferase YrrM
MHKTPYKSILHYYWIAKTKYSLHSPFVFDFFNTVMNVSINDPKFKSIEKERRSFIKDTSEMTFVEYGAGSKSKNGNSRVVADVAKSSLSGAWQCRLLYNLIKRYKPGNILEIGTSLGICTAYLATAANESTIITLEGNPSSAEKAKNLFDKLGLSNIELIEGEFGITIDKALTKSETIDCAFIDGNHRKQATIEYFHQIREKADSNSFIIVDDIYWSTGMQEAWQEIIAHKSVAFSINLFRFGIVFFDHSIMEKQHFLLIEAKWKLWSFGVFG